MVNRNVGLKVEGSSFTLDGSPFLIIAGTIHYFRVPREYWRDRLLKLKACGFNTLTTMSESPFDISRISILWIEPALRALKGLPLNRVTVACMQKSNFQRQWPVQMDVVLSTVHMKHIKKETYDTLLSIQGHSPILMMVYTASSLDGWGISPHSVDSHLLMRDVREMFNASFSLNFYMFHGGTNFGFMDYGALLTENGEHTTEYLAYQEFFSSSLGIPKPPHRDTIPMAIYKSVVTAYYMSLWDVMPYLEEPIRSVKPICMEKLSVNQGNGQSSGYILYETVVTTSGLLTTKGHVQDRGQVFLDEEFLGVLDHSTHQLTIPRKMVYKGNPTLRILVENQGRLAYGQDINKERKGLIGDIYLNNFPLRKFKIYSLDMKTQFLQRDLPNIWKPASFKHRGPAFFLGILRMGNYPRDTFIKMEGWTKGVIFINGRNLGRYWNIGPQETLYLPGPWLHPGSNEIIVFEEFKPGLEIHFTNISHLAWYKLALGLADRLLGNLGEWVTMKILPKKLKQEDYMPVLFFQGQVEE
ncbi:hypothetical protein GH733_007225, partial [Mirounga leonina]